VIEHWMRDGCLHTHGHSGRQSFHCRHGKAYLFNMVVNVHEGPKEDRLMTTGLHTVADIHCKACMQIVGWKYVRRAFSLICLHEPAALCGCHHLIDDADVPRSIG